MPLPMKSSAAALILAVALAAAGSASAQSVPPRLQAVLQANKADYAQLRRAVLAEGWRPVVNPACQSNVYGGSVQEPIEPSPPSSNVCRILTEIEACSGDGYCNMYFSHPSQALFLRVSTYGDYGAPESMNVEGWEMSRDDGRE